MKERTPINGDVRNCTPCVNLTKVNGEWACEDRLNKPEIRFVEDCRTGPVLTIPKRGADMAAHLDLIQLRWRTEGEHGESNTDTK